MCEKCDAKAEEAMVADTRSREMANVIKEEYRARYGVELQGVFCVLREAPKDGCCLGVLYCDGTLRDSMDLADKVKRLLREFANTIDEGLKDALKHKMNP